MLKPVPVTDPTTLALPMDPFDALKARWRIGEIETWDETWYTPIEAVHLIRELFVGGTKGKGILRTKRIWDTEHDIGE